jgi:hypothetical protein
VNVPTLLIVAVLQSNVLELGVVKVIGLGGDEV